MKTIAVVNQKGGCGKTTVSINLASAIAEQGEKVLLVDMDPQSHCAVGLAVPEQQIEQSIYDVLISKSRNEPIRITEILWQISDRLDLAPASLDLSAFEQQMSGVNGRELCLKEVLKDIDTRYDYVVIDCPPAVGLLTFNALRAATDVIVPVETGYFALHGLSKQLETLAILCERCNQKVNVGVLASMYDIRTKMAREILAELKSHFSDRMFKTIINFNTKIKEAASFGQPISEYDPASKGQLDFKRLAEEVFKTEKFQQRKDLVSSLSNQLSSISTTTSELLKSEKIRKQTPEIMEIKPEYDQKSTEAVPVEVFSQQVADVQTAPIETFSEQPSPDEAPQEQQTAEPLPLEPTPTEPIPIEEPPLEIEDPELMEPEPIEEPLLEPQESEPIEEPPLESQEPELIESQPMEHEPMEEQTEQVEQPQTEEQQPRQEPELIESQPVEPEPMEEQTEQPQTEQQEPRQESELIESQPMEHEPMEEQTEQPQTEQQEPDQQQEPTMESTNVKLADYYGVNQINEAVIFVSLYPRASSVQIAGDFNNWQPAESPMEKVGESGIWQTKTNLPPGKYQYRLVVDGQWQQDPYNENSILNPYGEYNSVLEVN
jgi:chromosome partitioning protein